LTNDTHIYTINFNTL